MSDVDNNPSVMLERALAVALRTELPMQIRQQHLEALRRSHPRIGASLDEQLITRCVDQAAAIAELGGAIERLKELLSKLTSPPLHEGLFLGQVTLADGRVLARVRTAQREALLPVADPDLLPGLQLGDRVHLSAESNAVIGKSTDGIAEPGVSAVAIRWLADRRLVVRHRDEELVVRATASLEPDKLAPGDTVRLDRSTWLAIERLEADPKSPLAPSEEATSLPPEALAGCDELRDGILRRITSAIAHPDIAASYGLARRRPGILLGGPPGVGKTMFARVIASMLQEQTGQRCMIRKVNGAELLSPYVGETEQRIKSLMHEVNGRSGPDDWSMLFIDEIDAIGRARGISGNSHGDRFLGTWLSELEGFDGRARCILVAATNRLDMLDPALRARFSHEIQVPRPRLDAARAIFECHLPPDADYGSGGTAADTRSSMIDDAVARLYMPNAAGASIATLRFRDGKTRVVPARELMSGRLIEQICIEAREHAFLRHVEGGRRGISGEDLDLAVDAALDRMRCTLTLGNVHDQLTDLAQDVQVVAVDAAPPARSKLSFLGQAA